MAGREMRGGTARRAGRGGKDEVGSADFTTYCIRLNGAEKALLERALSRKGWTPTHFVRQATLEKAAHVENVSTPNTFDFDGLVRRLAKQLCEPAVWIGDNYDPETQVPAEEFFASNSRGGEPYAFTEPRPLTLKDVEVIRTARRLGGTEFLGQLLQECERLVAYQRTDLPPPIDPERLGNDSEKQP